jgi:hypothetical protein
LQSGEPGDPTDIRKLEVDRKQIAIEGSPHNNHRISSIGEEEDASVVRSETAEVVPSPRDHSTPMRSPMNLESIAYHDTSRDLVVSADRNLKIVEDSALARKHEPSDDYDTPETPKQANGPPRSGSRDDIIGPMLRANIDHLMGYTGNRVLGNNAVDSRNSDRSYLENLKAKLKFRSESKSNVDSENSTHPKIGRGYLSGLGSKVNKQGSEVKSEITELDSGGGLGKKGTLMERLSLVENPCDSPNAFMKDSHFEADINDINEKLKNLNLNYDPEGSLGSEPQNK